MPDINPNELPSADVDAHGTAPPRGAGRHGAAWIGLAVLLMAGAGGGAWWHFGHAHQEAKAAPPPMPVPVMTASASTVPVYRSFPAVTQAMRTVPIQARVTGYLAEQGAVDGADVASGALLYRVEADDYRAAFLQAQATRVQADASLKYARATNGRNAILARQGWTSHDAFDQINSTYRQGVASVATNVAAVQEAALTLGRTEIRAPFAGRIGASQVFKGSLISVAGTTLNTLVQLDPIYVTFNPAEANLAVITREQALRPVEAEVSVDGGRNTHAGALTFIDNQVSLSTGTIMLRATIANPDHALLPGQYVTARLHLGDLRGAILVPQSAVVSSQIGQALMIAGAGDKVEQRIVTLGDTDGAMVVVATGLKPGERVVTGQLQKLHAGDVVQPTPGKPS